MASYSASHLDTLLALDLLAAGRITQVLRWVKDEVPDIPVFANTGVNVENVKQQLTVADGAIVGTAFKFDGIFQNRVDLNRVKLFMERVKDFRTNLKNSGHEKQ
jgi:hypothetical protein